MHRTLLTHPQVSHLTPILCTHHLGSPAVLIRPLSLASMHQRLLRLHLNLSHIVLLHLLLFQLVELDPQA